MRDPGVLGPQVARRTQLNGQKRVANTASGSTPCKGTHGLEAQRTRDGAACQSSQFREYPAGPAPEWGWGRHAGGEAGPASPQGSRGADSHNNSVVIKLKGR